MEGLQNLRYLLQEGDYMCKLDLKDAYYCVPLQKNSRKYVRFHWSGNLYEFLCLCFGLGLAQQILTNSLKVPFAILHRINIRTIIYLDDMLLMGHSIEEISMCRETVIFLLQHLGFAINWKKSVLTPLQEIEFLGPKINQVNLEILLTEEKMQNVKTKCQNLTDRTSNFDFRINKSDWFVDINNPSSTASKITMSVSLAAVNIIFKGKPFISAKNSSEPPIKNRITMVDNKSRSLQWPIIKLASCTGFHTDRCLSKGLGGYQQWYISRRNVVSHGNEILHQYHRIISSKTSHKDIHKIQRCQSHTSSNRQYCCLNIFDGNGRYSKSENDRVGQENLGISFEVGDHNYCRIPLKGIEFNSRLGISKHFGLLRVDVESSNFSESLPNKGFSRDRFVYISSITSNTNLRCMKTRSSQSCNRCISIELVTQIPVCFSLILIDSKSSQQNTQGKSSEADINNPSLGNTSLVSKDFEHVNQESYFAALEKGRSKKS